ncbi:MAG: hypothetical protein IPL65_14610 [Lewinellaceae bacterium]|nr:hypothetical protein [Lewinellaceae bacterium]
MVFPLDESFEPFAEYESPGSDSLRWLALPFSLETTTEFRALQQQIELYNIQWKSQRAEGYPTLSAHASAWYQTQRADLQVWDPNRNSWYGMANVGVKSKYRYSTDSGATEKPTCFAWRAKKLEVDRPRLHRRQRT